jgi:hypothetical protein
MDFAVNAAVSMGITSASGAWIRSRMNSVLKGKGVARSAIKNIMKVGGNMEKYKDFNDYLMNEFAKEYVGTDDAMVDAFDLWLEGVQPDEFIKYGNDFAKNLVRTFVDNLKDRL